MRVFNNIVVDFKDAGCIDTLQKLLQTSGIWSVKAAKQLFKLQAKQNNFTDAMFSLQSLLGSYHHHSANDALIIDGTIERILGSLLDDYFEPTITALLDDEDASEINLVSFLEGSLLAIQTKLADSCEVKDCLSDRFKVLAHLAPNISPAGKVLGGS